MEIFSVASLELNPESVARQVRFSDQTLIRRLVDDVGGVLDSKAAFRISYIDEKAEDGVLIDGVRFSSRVLRRNLDGVGRVFPFVMTVGAALDKLMDATGDMLDKFLLDAIGNIALREARRLFQDHMRTTFALEKISFMSPGSLADWPIQEQKNLFSLLAGVESTIGVRLTESLLMLPRKSVSGIFFSSEASFFSCQLCPREGCEGRKARYDEAKAREYGVLK